MVVVFPPLLDQHAGFGQAVEYLAGKELVAQLAVEALNVAVFPRAAWLDKGCLRTHALDPILHRGGYELRAIVGADVPGDATHDEQVRQHVDDVSGFQPARDPDRQAFTGELVHHVQHAELATVPGAVLHKVISPDVVRPLWPQPHARAVVQPQPPALRLPRRYLQPFRSPDPLHPLVVRVPAFGPQQRGDPPIAVAAVSLGQLNNSLRQRCLVVRRPTLLALRGTVLPQHPACRALGHLQRRRDVVHGGSTTSSA